MAFTPFYHWCQYIYMLCVEFFGVGFHYLVFRHAFHLLDGNERVSLTSTRIKQAHKVIDLSNSTDSRARILAGRFLFDSNNRTKARDLVYIRALPSPHKLP